MATADPLDLLRLLADSTRVRLLALLAREALSVVELQEILGMGQSRISSHLALLKQADLVSDRREGKRSFYSMVQPRDKGARDLLSAVLQATDSGQQFRDDHLNLERILGRRRELSEAYFAMVAGKFEKNYCPGRSWEAIGHFLLLLTPHIDIVDLGAGEGLLSQLLARRARSVTCIDNSPAMVKVGTALAKDNSIDNLSYQLGDIESIPLADGCADLAILSQALHHANHPPRAITEALRILRPGGRLAILDLKQHQFDKARELYADRWLGFTPNQIYAWMQEAGFTDVSVDSVAREPDEPYFETLLAVGSRPE
jgi:ArsR family transcriptional regulator